MADAKSRLEKLARLKQMKGAKKSEKPAEPKSQQEDVFSLDDVVVDEAAPMEAPEATTEQSDGVILVAPSEQQAPAEQTNAEDASAAPAQTDQPEEPAGDDSLSSYFEALGVSEPGTKAEMVTDKPQSVDDPKSRLRALKKQASREVGPGDLWKDPVRDSDAFIGSFVDQVNPLEEAPSIESIIGESGEPKRDAVESEELENEEAVSEAPPQKSAETPEPDAAIEGPLTIAFDEARAKLLLHVSKQMGCSIDDVVVTALDWYLDALFGDDHTYDGIPDDVRA